jgi:hypothetical protein
MTYDPVNGEPHIRVTLGSDTITINGDVNLVDNVRVNNTALQSIPVYLTSNPTVALDTASLAALENINATVSGTVSIGTDGTVSLSAATLSALENITVGGSVNVSNFPASQAVTGTFWQATQPVSGNVTATITDVITVVVNDDAGALYAFNNHAASVNRGWTMDNTMRPVISIRNGSASAADLIKIVEYEIGNNNANQSTIVYEWYEGPLTIAGAAIPAWTTFGIHSQYRVYQDQYSSNQGNTFTVPNGNGTYMRHSGIIIGKNTSGDEGPASMHGGATDADKNMLTLCMKRVDNATKLDVWFAFTIKELV